MEKAKYIVFDTDIAGPAAVIFPSFMIHAHMAMALGGVCGTPISAGFVEMNSGEIYVSGKSISLGCKSRPRDVDIIERMFYEGSGNEF